MTVTTVGLDLAKDVCQVTAFQRRGARSSIRKSKRAKRGDRYLRTLLIHGACAVMRKAAANQTREVCGSNKCAIGDNELGRSQKPDMRQQS